MPGSILRTMSLVLACVAATVSSAWAADRPAVQEVREETWALMTPLPIFAYVVRPVGGGPYPLLIMNHGISGDPQQRGCQLSILVRDQPRELLRALEHNGVVCDFREPNVIRVAPVPLYNTFREVWSFAGILARQLA